MYDNIFLGNIKKLYKSAVKYNYQRKYKLILEASIFSTPEGGTYNSLMLPCQSMYVKIPSARKSLREFSEAFYVKHNSAVCRLGHAKSKLKLIISGNTLRSSISKHLTKGSFSI